MKVWNYVVIMVTLIIFLNLIGLGGFGETPILNELSININNTDTQSPISQDPSGSNMFLIVFVTGLSVAILTGGFAIATALFTQSSLDWKIVALPPMITLFTLFIMSGWNILQLARNSHEGWLVAVIGTIFIPLLIGFLISAIEWFAGGNDG
jgi:hypothetical protein